MKTLLICYTPLHVMIAERLVREQEVNDFYLLYVYFNKSQRHENYFERLAAKATCGATMLCLHHDLRDLSELMRRKRQITGIGLECLMTGNIKHFHSRYIAYLCGIKRFRSFDDGSGNIVGGGYFDEMREALIGQVIFSTFGASYLYRNVVRKIETHYTIYDEPNVFAPYAKKIERVNLFDDLSSQGGSPQKKTAKIYLGHALVEDRLCSRERAAAIDEAICKRFAIEFFIPHPRSKNQSEYAPVRKLAIEEPYAAEELVFKLLGRFGRVLVVGINSTALLNVTCSERVRAVNVDVAGLFASGALRAVMDVRNIDQITEVELYDHD